MDIYEHIEEQVEKIFDCMLQISEAGELTSCFPVGAFVDLNTSLLDFRNEVEGAKKRSADFNSKIKKEFLNNLYGYHCCDGCYHDTDGLKVKVSRHDCDD